MSKVFERNQLSASRVELVLNKLGVDVETFATEYVNVPVTRKRKSRMETLTEEQTSEIRSLLSNRTPEREVEVMASLGIKTRTTLDRIIAEFASSLV
jgi:hypothetical protein